MAMCPFFKVFSNNQSMIAEIGSPPVIIIIIDPDNNNTQAGIAKKVHCTSRLSQKQEGISDLHPRVSDISAGWTGWMCLFLEKNKQTNKPTPRAEWLPPIDTEPCTWLNIEMAMRTSSFVSPGVEAPPPTAQQGGPRGLRAVQCTLWCCAVRCCPVIAVFCIVCCCCCFRIAAGRGTACCDNLKA